MPLQDWMKVISVDDHVIEHPLVWQDRLSESERAQGPQIIETAEGHHVWRYEGQLYPQIGLNAVAGKPPAEYGMEPVRYDQMIPGCYDPAERLKDMDIDGIHGALCFPSFPGFGGGVFQRAKDKDLALSCVRAWNDFQVEEWCASAPGRLIPLGILPTWDPHLAAAEVERLAQIGTRAVSFPDSPVPLDLPSFHHPTHWEPLWDALEAADLPVCLHFGSGGYVPGFPARNPSPQDTAPFAVAIATFSTNLMWSTADLVFSGMLQRHPNLKFMLSEGGIGWIPYLLERMDYTWERHRWYQKISRTDRPSDLFRRHFWGCFIDDEHGVASRDAIGIENILIEVDYPHSDSNWPNSRKRIAETLREVSDSDVHRIVELNARELLHLGDR
ncbi:amidohydrolase family protein [Mycobacterium sp. UM_Kg1]|uniref:amidohydrolase family protein n=1 Tax=Mycobacterium sp. UM_Kg1 TaxID=1545691 RepID=UPI00061B40B7|nr:amidohydrolase family protein [Mycobacterium sp. UM_Kg1]